MKDILILISFAVGIIIRLILGTLILTQDRDFYKALSSKNYTPTCRPEIVLKVVHQ